MSFLSFFGCVLSVGQIGVELRVVHLTEEYWSLVVSHCMDEIQSGRTPNPDMLCNSRVKFGEPTKDPF